MRLPQIPVLRSRARVGKSRDAAALSGAGPLEPIGVTVSRRRKP